MTEQEEKWADKWRSICRVGSQLSMTISLLQDAKEGLVIVWAKNEQARRKGRVWKRQILPLNCDCEVELGKNVNRREKIIYKISSKQYQQIATNAEIELHGSYWGKVTVSIGFNRLSAFSERDWGGKFLKTRKLNFSLEQFQAQDPHIFSKLCTIKDELQITAALIITIQIDTS